MASSVIKAQPKLEDIWNITNFTASGVSTTITRDVYKCGKRITFDYYFHPAPSATLQNFEFFTVNNVNYRPVEGCNIHGVAYVAKTASSPMIAVPVRIRNSEGACAIKAENMIYPTETDGLDTNSYVIISLAWDVA